MPRRFGTLELEWKIMLLACGILLAFAWPVQKLYVSRMERVLQESVDPRLEVILRGQIADVSSEDRADLVASLERNRQWTAMIPIIIREQRRAVFTLSIVLFLLLMILSIWTLKRLTQPLKSLALATDRIGRGEKATVRVHSGGALGRLEEALLNMQKELAHFRDRAQVEGMEQAWRDIAKVMAHEIKNPLTPIRLSLDRIQEQAAGGREIGPDELERFCERITSQVENLERLVNAFRSFAREPEVRTQSVQVRGRLEKIAGDMAARIETSMAGDAEVLSDPYLLDQVFLNLWKNSLEAGATSIRCQVGQRADVAQIRICDNGPGIPEDQIEKVWIPYVSFKKGGSGLGLPVVRRLVESMQGTISLESPLPKGNGNGLCVTVVLPLGSKKEGA